MRLSKSCGKMNLYMLIIFCIFVINQITMAKLNIEISGEFNTGKSTAPRKLNQRDVRTLWCNSKHKG